MMFLLVQRRTCVLMCGRRLTPINDPTDTPGAPDRARSVSAEATAPQARRQPETTGGGSGPAKPARRMWMTMGCHGRLCRSRRTSW